MKNAYGGWKIHTKPQTPRYKLPTQFPREWDSKVAWSGRWRTGEMWNWGRAIANQDRDISLGRYSHGQRFAPGALEWQEPELRGAEPRQVSR